MTANPPTRLSDCDTDIGAWLTAAFHWLEAVVETRVTLLFETIKQDRLRSPDYAAALAQQRDRDPPPALPAGLLDRGIGALEDLDRRILILAAAAEFAPERLDGLEICNPDTGRIYTEFGGITGPTPGFRPTATTAAFLFGDQSPTSTLALRARCGPRGHLTQVGLLSPPPLTEDPCPPADPPIRLNPAHAVFNAGAAPPPPGADRFSTALDWEALVLPPAPAAQLKQIIGWMRHRRTLSEDWGFGARGSFGYRALFYGPPGTGKSLTAALLGKVTESEVYRINLAAVVSKWVGETEKALDAIFNQADADRVVLFFDEADALFGKRGAVSTSTDRYANLEVSFLLQRLERFNGLVILATNLRGNLDEAFTRRFQSIIHFPTPGDAERLALWQKALAPPVRLGEAIDIEALAQMAPLTGAGVENATRAAALSALVAGAPGLRTTDLHSAIKHEAAKEGQLLLQIGGPSK